MTPHTRAARWQVPSHRLHWDPAIAERPDYPYAYPLRCWTGVQGIPTILSEVTMTYEHIIDEPMWARSHMQDQVRTRLDWDFAHLSQEGMSMAQDPGLNVRFYNIGIPGEVFALTDAEVQSSFKDLSTGNPWTPHTEASVHGTSASDMYARLKREQITKFCPNFKDPLETEFSIWYLLRDFQEAPSLIKSLKRALKVLKAQLGHAGRLRQVYLTRSLNQVANLRLANEYGIQPTIADLKEFTSVVLKWYDTWVKKTHTFGKLRTWRQRKQLPSIQEPNHERQLQFPVWQTGVGYAHAFVVSGEYQLNTTVKYYFVCPELTNRMNAIRHAIDALGFLDPAALWDKVPFSFVVDWFYNISGLLHRMKPRLLPVTLVIADWCESLNRTQTIDIRLSYTGTVGGYPESVKIRERFARVKVFQQARKRQFPRELQIETRSLLGNGLTVNRIINGSCVINGLRVRKRSSKSPNYRKRE